MVTWKSIAARLLRRLECKSANDCMDERVNVVSDNARLFEVVPTVVEHEYVLVRAKDKTITGIVTATDLLYEVGHLAEPFLFIGEIERHLRKLIHGKFTLDQLKAAAKDSATIKSPADLRTLLETSWLSPCVAGSFSTRWRPGSNAPGSTGPEYAPGGNRRVPRDIGGVDNFISITALTFGGYCSLLENRDNWTQLALNIDRKVFVKYLHSVREIRNDVMHFDPDGLDNDNRKKLRDLARFFDKRHI